MIKQRVMEWIARFDALSLRERGLLALVLLVLLYVVWNNVLMQPLDVQKKHLRKQLGELQQQVTLLEEQAQQIVTQHTADPDKEDRARRMTLTTRVEELNRRLRELTVDLIPPARMADVLKDLLSRQTTLKLVRLESLAPRPLLEEPTDDKNKTQSVSDESVMYRHGLRVEFEGGYLSTIDYLKKIEALPWTLFWGSIDFQVQQYPDARVSITVHTLSLQEGWIGV